MTPERLLALYCAVIILASLVGGLIPQLVRLTHRRLEIALSFVSGVMLGLALVHLLPHALMERVAALGIEGPAAAGHGGLDVVVRWLLGGLLAMFLIERCFSFHHHEAPPAERGHGAGVGQAHGLRWVGAAIGLTLHTLIAGAALGASVWSEARHARGAALAGFATFLIIVLHKPFDALTISTLMLAGRSSRRACHLVNGLFSLAVPVGAALFLLGVGGEGAAAHGIASAALAFSAGTFLCIALSDLLPELHFHRHDRLVLSLSLLLGVGVALAVTLVEGSAH